MQTTKMQTTKWTYLLPVIAALFWGGNFVAGRATLPEVPPFTLSLLRWALALVIILPFAFRDIRGNYKKYLAHWRTILAMGFLGIAAFTAMVYVSIQHTTAINAAILSAWAPLMIVIVSYFVLKEKINSFQVIGIVLAFLGVIWIVSKGSLSQLSQFQFNPGDLLMLVANLIWAFYSILVRKTAEHIPGLTGFALSIAAGVLFLLPASLWELGTHEAHLASGQVIGSVLYLGIFASVIAFFCWTLSVQRMGPSKASPFLNLVPLFATVFAIILLGEKLQVAQAIGGMFILIGVLTSFQQPRLRRASKPFPARNEQTASEVNV